jgi:hypothetical protein
MVQLFANMAADGLIALDLAAQQGRNSAPTQTLATQLAALA